MNTNPLKKGMIGVNLSGIGTVTWEMVKQRAAEIALINARPEGRIEVSDWIEAKRELTGETKADPSGYELLSSAHASRPKIAQESPSEDTDQEGHSISAQLVEQGLEEAEHDTMLQAAKNPRPNP